MGPAHAKGRARMALVRIPWRKWVANGHLAGRNPHCTGVSDAGIWAAMGRAPLREQAGWLRGPAWG